jgi:hypothetical protein
MKMAKTKFMIWQFSSGEDLAEESYAFETLKFQHEKEGICKMMSTAYARKSVLCLCGGVSVKEVLAYLGATWDSFLTSEASVVAVNKSEKIMGVVLCQEFHPKLKKVKGLSNMRYIIELQRFCAVKAIHQIGAENSKILLVLFCGTAKEATPSENVIILVALIKGVMERAKQLGYDLAILASENPAVASICEDTVKYSQLDGQIQLNQFVGNDHSIPFQNAPSYERMSVYCRYFT